MRHDRGSVTPLVVALIAVLSLALTAMNGHLRAGRLDSIALTAAEALALSVASGGDPGPLARRYGVEEYIVEFDGPIVNVRVRREGRVGRAAAVDHRRTLGGAE